MRTIHLARVTLGFFLLATCARVAGAQTYVWTDERGVVHAASDPSEVPASQRQKAIRNAEGRRDSVTISQDATPPAAPAASDGTNGGGVGLDVDPEVTPERQAEPDEPKKTRLNPKNLPPPDEGFEWNCPTDPEGGPPKCEQFEKQSSKTQRRAAARAKARADMKVTPQDEFDPEIARKVNQRAEEEYKKTTPVPRVLEPKRKGEDASEGTEAGDEEIGNDEHSDDEPEN